MKWSQYQLDIFKAVSNTDKNIVIKATAGASKTTVLKECAKLIPRRKKSLLLAFNKSIADEIRTKIPDNVECMTLHSLGLKMLTKNYGSRIKLNNWKSLNFISKKLDEWGIDAKKKNYYQFNIFNLVNMCRLLMANRTIEDIKSIAERFDIEAFDKQAEHTLEILATLDRYNVSPYTHTTFLIDFTDMLELPLKLNLLKREYDVVFVDEVQDNSLLQQKLFLGIIKENGRFIVVGDPKQSIYSFIGADINSFNNLISQPNTIQLPLSISYRCPKSVVKRCREINEDIEPWEDAQEGEDREGSINEVKSGDFVLCRNNRPLISLYFKFLSEGKKAYVKGKDYGSGLIKILEPLKHLSKTEAFGALQDQLDYIEDKLRENEVDKPKLHSTYRSFQEKIEMMSIIINNVGTPIKAFEQLDKIFKDDGIGITLSTIHKAKGMENRRIFIIRRDLIPSKYATQAWSMEQEMNLLFVAYSRAKESLIFVNDYNDEKKEESPLKELEELEKDMAISIIDKEVVEILEKYDFEE